jgi:LuxR family quorum sensing-dependent transcriptional regulator
MASPAHTADTFTCIEELGRLSSPAGVVTTLERNLARFGCETAIFTGLPASRERLEDLVVLNSWPPEYFRLYTERRFVDVCPIARHCRNSLLPFEWSDAPYDPEQEPRTAAVLSIAADFGMARGLTVPVPDRHGPNRAVSLSGPRLDLAPHSKHAMHLIALYGFERLSSLILREGGSKPNVTPREREVLTWIARGKSAWEIGEILSIAKRTVDEHAQTAFRKLDAVNRTQAVAIALRDRLIEL